jgi:hypothetical protein
MKRTEVRVKSITRSARWAVAAMALLAPGCSKKAPEPTTPAVDTAAATAAPAAPAASVVVHGTRRLAHPDVPVFVDGAQVGVLRYGELPPSVKATLKPGDELKDERYYRFHEYLKAVGVSLDQVKAVHFAGKGSRIMSVEGSELRADKNKFLFDFSFKETGMPREAWDQTGLKSTTWIDYMSAVYVFAKREVPKVDPDHHCYWLEANAACDEAAPYAEGAVAKGTRIYVDGKMVGFVKRRKVDDTMLVGKKEDGTEKYSLSAVISSFGVDLANAKGVELLAGDAVVARATRDQWAAKQSSIFFTLPKHGHGKVQTLIPADIQAAGEGVSDRESTITAVQVYRNTDPSKRPLAALDDVPEIALTGEGQQQAALGSGNGRANEL